MQNIRIMLTGLLTLVAVMGIGRFSLTPQIPLMIHDGWLSLSSAGVLAAMNYIGYLLGAIHVSYLRKNHVFYLRAGLLATIVVTLLSGTTSLFALQCLFRFVSGVGGAWALIIVTSWTQHSLAARHPRLSALTFTGPGVGITLSGVLAWLMTLAQFTAAQAWYSYGVAATLIGLLVSRDLPRDFTAAKATATEAQPEGELRKLVLVYTLAGFGYILPATFLSQMAHAVFTDASLAAFFWPLFGLSAVAGVLLVILFSGRFATRASLAFAMIMQGAGVAAAVIVHNAWGLLFSTVLTGLGFLAIMQLTMRFVREISGVPLSRAVGLLTSGYASGQLVGPLVSSVSVLWFGSLEPAIVLAALCLVVGGVTVCSFKPRASA